MQAGREGRREGGREGTWEDRKHVGSKERKEVREVGEEGMQGEGPVGKVSRDAAAYSEQ